ncbi:MAG: hypothetical protein ACOH19_04750 [Rhodoglobus sp.]
MRRLLIIWSVIGAVVLGAFGITVLALNSTVYSASGFVLSYLDALGRRDAVGALEIAGDIHLAEDDQDASRQLLAASVISIPEKVEVVADVATESGTHRITVGYDMDGTHNQSTYEIKPGTSVLGVFSGWSFVTAPVAVMHVSVLGDARFTANGTDLVSPTPNAPAPYLVFTPSNFVLDHVSNFLEANDVTVTATEPGASIPTAVDVRANEKFVAAVQAEVDSALNECTTQQVLQPTGCPFGQAIRNRIVTTPAWSIASYPVVTIEQGPNLQWKMPTTPGAAHLVVDIRSIYDGDVSTFDEDVPFQIGYTITLLSDTEVVISPAS